MATLLALGGMVGCTAAPDAPTQPDDLAADRVWACLARGDAEGAIAAVLAIEDARLAERARLDVQAATEGRAAALVACLDAEDWLAARYLASDEAALRVLAQARRRGADDGAVLWLEEARRSATGGRRLSAARAAQRLLPGGPEGLALEVEQLVAQGRLQDARARWASRPPETARLCLLGRQLDARVGRDAAVVEGVLSDLGSGLAVPASLSLLEGMVRRGTSVEQEARLRDTLEEQPIVGARMARARDRLLAILLARAGRVGEAVAALERCAPLLPEEEAARRRWALRADGGAPATLEERLEADPARAAGQDLVVRRLASEWDLAARESYLDAAEGEDVPLDAFCRRLDDAARPLGVVPALSDLPRRSFGVFGTMLDTTALEAHLPDAVVLGGQALGMPAELAWFDRVACEERVLPEPLGAYRECLVRRPRVLGRLAAAGVSVSGAGLDRLVWLDLDELSREAYAAPSWAAAVPQLARPARGRAERLALDEPLDVVSRLQRQVLADGPEAYAERLLGTVAAHERQHIVDFQEFVGRGLGGRLLTLAGAGLLPGAVRAAIERHAQLAALRDGPDPRLALAQAVAQLPVEGARRGDEHAAGYASLVQAFVARLDQGRLPDGTEPEDHGIDRGRVLVQQLDRLPSETIRAIARDLDV